jgi:transposase
MEIITRGERRRSWTLAQKQAIVAESLGSDLTPTEVAAKHGISSGQLYTWRGELLNVQNAVTLTRATPRFAEVELTPGPCPKEPALEVDQASDAAAVRRTPLRPCGLMEVVLRDGIVLRVYADVDSDALRRVLDVLAR